MKQPINFSIGDETFSLEAFVNSKIDNPEVQRLIRTLKKLDSTYILHEPMEEDKILPIDNWSSHCAEELGISLEFVLSKFCYISFNEASKYIVFSQQETEIDSLLTRKISYGNTSEIAYISKDMIKDQLLPNRYTIILDQIRNER